MRLFRLTGAGIILATAVLAAQDFDFETIRSDFFAGAAGDAAALKRAIAVTERVLAGNPKDAQALSVHGFGTMLAASEAFKASEPARGSELFRRGLANMNEAVELTPSDMLVRALRGILLQQASRQMPPPAGAAMLENARSDFQFLFDTQLEILDQLGTHRLGELLQALGDVHSRQGRAADAERYYAMIQQKLPDTEYARRAADWLRTRQPLPAERTACIGCHTGLR